MRFAKAVLRSIRRSIKTKYIDCLVWRHNLLGWPNVGWAGVAEDEYTEKTLNYLIQVVRQNAKLFRRIDQIPVATCSPLD